MMQYKTNQLSDKNKGLLFIITAAFLWAIAAPLAKYLFNFGIKPTDLVQARITYSFLLLVLIFLLFQRSAFKIDLKDLPYLIVLGIVGLALVQFTYFYTISKIDVGVAIALQYTAPSMIVVYSGLFLRKPISANTLLAIFLALIGCYFVVGAYEISFEQLNWEGILGGLASAVTFAFYTLFSKKGLDKYNSWTVFLYALLFATLFWNIIHPPLVLVGKGYDWSIWGLIFTVAFVGTLLPFALFFMALKKLDAVRVTVTSTLEPIFATILAFLMIGEQLTVAQASGGLFIIISVVLMARNKA